MSDVTPLVLHGDCLSELRLIDDATIDAVVTDPPYGLEFMGKAWDKYTPLDFERWCESWARECLRILKPGGHLLAFGGSRTWHRLAAGVEDAGFELRDSIAWLYGSGFPKSMDVSKAIDKAAAVEREVLGRAKGAASSRTESLGVFASEYDATAPATDEAREWAGWGTALKPAFEPIVVARKPLIGTVAANVLAHRTGALNIDTTRISAAAGSVKSTKGTKRSGGIMGASTPRDTPTVPHDAGRWPANVVLDESQAAALDERTGMLTNGANPKQRGADKARTVLGEFAGQDDANPQRGLDSGGASRFYYVAKAPKSERPVVDGTAHPTVKPLALMRWLIRLVTPPGGLIVDPFAGSGTTLEAAMLEGMHAIGVELTPDYWPLIEARIARVTK